ncbi:GUN4 domain-containing protein [Nostoc linckia FACHB-104]|nr:GUN4 domain-containing protein [Nostoc linckia FACHB-104]
MVKNWALVIGINHYDFLQPLKYAKRDAELMQNLLHNEAGFERVFLFTDDSPSIGGELTRPDRTNLFRFLQQLFERPFLQPEDNFWFFFNGHGMNYGEQDYLLAADGNPEDIENTGISLSYLTECLRNSGSDNIVLMLDANHHQHQGHGLGIGRQTQNLARQTGVISILSCTANQSSAEIDALQQGAFTHALLEGLGSQGQCATVKRLHQYVSFRVPELLAHYKYPLQTPVINAEPVAKSQRVVIQKYANLHDIAKNQRNGLPTEVNSNREFVQLEELWSRTNTVNPSVEKHTVKDISRIAQYAGSSENFTPNPAVCASPVQVMSHDKTHNIYTQAHTSTLTIPQPAIDDLTSERGIDYQRLSELLAAGDWKAADRETCNLMLKVAAREEAGWLDIPAINKFPYTDLCTIDRLWVKYSKGRFGFTVQKQIWESVGGEPDADYETWCKFGDRIGWRVNDAWLFYSDLNFVDDAPIGHFPAAAAIDLLTVRQGWVVGLFGCLVGFSALSSRLAQSSVMQ